jgi:uncharacterized SAM-binding protein YcdF (DUF218 family)
MVSRVEHSLVPPWPDASPPAGAPPSLPLPPPSADGASRAAFAPLMAPAPPRLHRSEHRERLHAAAACALIDGKTAGNFAQARRLMQRIVRDVPDDWNARACLAFIAWSERGVDARSLAMMERIAPAKAARLREVHALIEQTLAECAFEPAAPGNGEHPAIVVPGKQLTDDGEIDDDLRERLTTALQIAQASPAAPIVLSGAATVTDKAECDVMADWLEQAGIPRERMLLDREATVTTANVLRTIAMLRTHTGVNAVRFVTSDYHMRRASVIFRIALLRSGLPMTLKPVIAGGRTLPGAAGNAERIAVYLDALRACELIANRAQPAFYRDAQGIGDHLPGDPEATVRVDMHAPPEWGDPPALRDVVTVTQLGEGALVRAAAGALLARVLSAFRVMPSGRIEILKSVNVGHPAKAVTDACAELGLQVAKIEDAGERIVVHVTGASDENAAASKALSTLSTLSAPTVPSGERVPLMRIDPDDDARERTSLVVGGARFAVTPSGQVRMNGTLHAIGFDSTHAIPDGALRTVRVQLDDLGEADWTHAWWTRVGREAARLLGPDGRLVISTGRKPHVPRALVIDALKACGFGKVAALATYRMETPFYPAMSDPSAGGVTFTATRKARAV